MSQATAHAHAHAHEDDGLLRSHGSVLQTQIPNGKIAMWLFLASEVMFFTGLIGAYIILRFGQGQWVDPTKALNVPLTAANTFLLICSSVTLVYALQNIQMGNRGKGNWGLLLTTLFGAVFVGVQAYEYYELYFHHGTTPFVNIFGGCFYVMTGFHGLHVFAGVIAMGALTGMGLKGKFGPNHYAAVENTGLYWHFVDLVWIILFAIVYLI
jgi:heme/copper-type cytochrome/quinol oxidase subunit 3